MSLPPKLDFESYEELGAVLGLIARRLHYVNRVAAGESGFVWHYAQVLQACAALAPLCRDAGMQAEFGDGWTKGKLDRDAAAERILELLRERL